MKNIEIKYRISQPDLLKQVLDNHPGVVFQYRHYQKDIYFNIPGGRLKLRLEDEKAPVLIRYYREDAARSRISEYDLQAVDDVDKTVAELNQNYGKTGKVEKWRTLYLFRNVRIHLDEVMGLGCFLEFEAVVSQQFPEHVSRQNLQEIQNVLNKFLTHPLAVSYMDLILNPQKEERR